MGVRGSLLWVNAVPSKNNERYFAGIKEREHLGYKLRTFMLHCRKKINSKPQVLSVVVRQQILPYLLLDSSRVNRLSQGMDVVF